jgi:hypothetical protein
MVSITACHAVDPGSIPGSGAKEGDFPSTSRMYRLTAKSSYLWLNCARLDLGLLLQGALNNSEGINSFTASTLGTCSNKVWFLQTTSNSDAVACVVNLHRSQRAENVMRVLKEEVF